VAEARANATAACSGTLAAFSLQNQPFAAAICGAYFFEFANAKVRCAE
jgi:hypothetical protein